MNLYTEKMIALQYNGKLIFQSGLRGIGFSARGKAGTTATLKIWKILDKNAQSEHCPIADIRFKTERKDHRILLDDHGLKPGDVFSFELVVRSGEAEVDDFSLLYDEVNSNPNSAGDK